VSAWSWEDSGITFFDYDRDGRLDLLVANSIAPHLPDYSFRRR